jgi:hypothetical protein
MNPETPLKRKCRKIPSSDVLLSPEDHDILKYPLSTDGYGYARIGVKKFVDRKVHKIVAVRMGLVTNKQNKLYIDHINRNKLDNRRENLRLLDATRNLLNSDKRISAKGFDFYKKENKYRVRMRVAGKEVFIGYFCTEEEARKAFVEAKNKRLTELGLTDLLLKQ